MQATLAFLARGDAQPILSLLPPQIAALSSEQKAELKYAVKTGAVSKLTSYQQSLVRACVAALAVCCKNMRCGVACVRRIPEEGAGAAGLFPAAILRCALVPTAPVLPCVQLALMAPLENMPAPPRYSSAFWVLLIVLPFLFLVPLASARSTATGLGASFPVLLTMLFGAVALMGSFLQGLTLQDFWQDVR